MEKVTTSVALHLRVSEYLRARGYTIDELLGPGIEDDSGKYCVIKVQQNVKTAHRFLWWTFYTHPLCIVSRVYLKNPNIGACKDNWIIAVYGREFFDEFAQLAKDICLEFQTQLHVRLEREEPEKIIYLDHH